MSEVRRPAVSGEHSLAMEAAGLHPDYPLPDIDDPIMAPFWNGCREHKLILQRDRHTGAVHWPLKPAYWKRDRLEYFEATGCGRVYTYVIGYEPFLPAFRDLLPHIMVVVQLDEGARIVGHMIDCAPDDMRFEMPVRIGFKPLTDRITLPVWRRA